jgi:outer membrane receptor protein involved in Fe transport
MANGKQVIRFGAIALAMALLSFPAPLRAQLATASINGAVTDPSGAVVPHATVSLQNVLSGARRTAITDASGSYYIPAIIPGEYTLHVSKTGFKTAVQGRFTLNVNQTATFNFSLQVGATTQNVTVSSVAIHLESSTVQLGTTITGTQVNNLPLNGRNFTELLELTPGVSRVQDDQAGSSGWAGNPIGSFSYPEINGQRDRSNLFLLDGLNDQGVMVGNVNVNPIIDQIQEFKVDTNNAAAQFGGATGGIINVVTKAGTNSFHGDAWEFMRNNAFDARDTFLPNVVAFKQNQFGGAVGGPVVIPHVYNGHDKTWFYAAYEGFRDHTTSTNLFTTVTPAELAGDFSAVSEPIYNPFSTTETASGGFTRTAFPGNQIPTSLLNTGMLTFAKGLMPAPIVTSIPGINGIDTQPSITRQDTVSLRFDHQFNTSNTMWIRYSGQTQPDSMDGGVPLVTNDVFQHGYQAAVSYTHIFSPTLVGTFQFGRNWGQDNDLYSFPASLSNLWQQAGFAPTFAANFGPSKNGIRQVSISVNAYLGWGNNLQDTRIADVHEWKGDMSKVYGHHVFMWGASFASTGFLSPIYYNNDTFSAINTDNPLNPTNTGNAMASYVLGVPNSANYRDVYETEGTGWADGFYGQDQWHATKKLTVNLGLRFDLVRMPDYGNQSLGNQYVGDLNLNNGTYIVQRVPGACGTGVGAPCIPGGTLPAHVVASSNPNRIYTEPSDPNWAPRIGLAYLLTPKTVLRAYAGRFYDDWAGIVQLTQNYEGTWPSIGQLIGNNLNLPEPGAPTPTVSALKPFGTSVLPAANPFNQPS